MHTLLQHNLFNNQCRRHKHGQGEKEKNKNAYKNKSS